MKVLVTGTQGQLARSLAEQVIGRPGLELTFTGRTEIDLAVRGSATEFIVHERPQAVINAAAYTAVDQAERQPELAFAVNAEGAGEVAAAAYAVGAPVIQLSTDYVFGGDAAKPYDEAAATRPINTYGRSKLAGEERVRAANRSHMIVRTSWVFSPFGTNFVKSMLRLASERKKVTVVADQFGCPTSALDLAGALLDVIARWGNGEEVGQGATYHLTGSGSCSWAEFAQGIFDASNELGGPSAAVVPIATSDYPTTAMRPRNSILDCRRFQADFGLVLPSWQSALDHLVPRLVEGQ